MSGDVEMWRIEWWYGRWSDSCGNHMREYVEGTERAHNMLLDLLCRQESRADVAGGITSSRRRFGSWFSSRSTPEQDEDKTLKFVANVKAWRMVDGEWVEQEMMVLPPELKIRAVSYPKESADS